MIIQLTSQLPVTDRNQIILQVKQSGYKATPVSTQYGEYLVCTGKPDMDIRNIGNLKGVADVHRVSDQFKLVSRKWKLGNSSVSLGDGVAIGGPELALIAGPCSIESEEQVEQIVSHLLKNKIRIMRGGVFKPRSSPYAFRGLGLEGMKFFFKACHHHGIKIVTEVMQVSQIETLSHYVDMFQVGARNTQNFNLLDALGQCGKPVLLKRGISGTIEELLYSAEYIFSSGNEDVVLCERGIRTFETSYRNTFDINAIQVLKDKTHLPVIADPSHGIGIRDYVAGIALASVAAGADGVIYEVHPTPEEALSDGQQTLNFQESETLVNKIRHLKSVL